MPTRCQQQRLTSFSMTNSVGNCLYTLIFNACAYIFINKLELFQVTHQIVGVMQFFRILVTSLNMNHQQLNVILARALYFNFHSKSKRKYFKMLFQSLCRKLFNKLLIHQNISRDIFWESVDMQLALMYTSESITQIQTSKCILTKQNLQG